MQAARIAGEGRYAIVDRSATKKSGAGQTNLVINTLVPEEPGTVQEVVHYL